MEGDLWAFLAKGLPFHKPVGPDYKTVLLFKRALFFHSCVVGATVVGLADIKDCCLIRPFYIGQLFCSCFQLWEAWLAP